MLGDINIAEPNALIGFAGPRVIEQTIKEKLPKGFQRSEFLLKHGMLDDVVPRKNLRAYIIRALRLFLNRRSMNSSQCRAYLQDLQRFGIKLGLENISAVLASFRHPAALFPVRSRGRERTAKDRSARCWRKSCPATA